MTTPLPPLAKAFVSCSLRIFDKPFVDHIESILKGYNITPFGTVGRYDAAPISPAEHMRLNIPQADIVVMVATPRYFQQDVHTGNVGNGLSEMLQVEAGMAYALNKPLVVFAQTGVNVGAFIPSVTQYIELDGNINTYLQKEPLIRSLLNNSLEKVRQNKSKELGKMFVGGLAIWGGINILDSLFKD